MTGDEIVALSEAAHHLRVVRARRRGPDSRGPRQGRVFLDARRQALPGLQQPVDVREHRARRPARREGHPGTGGEAPVRQPVHGHRGPRAAWREAGRDHARRHRLLLLHQRRRRGQRERHQGRALVHRSPQDPRALPLVSRRDRRRDHAHRRSAALGRRAGHPGRRARARSVSRHSARVGSASTTRWRGSRRSSSSKARTRSPASSSSR